MNTFHNLVMTAIQLNHEKRFELTSLKLDMREESYLREFCTIRLNIGRRTGKTTFIKDFCGTHKEQCSVVSQYNCREYRQLGIKSVGYVDNIPLGASLSEIVKARFIFVEDFNTEVPLNNLYSAMSRRRSDYNQTIIVL